MPYPQRPNLIEFWLLQTLAYSTRATCDRLRTATIVVKNRRLRAAGYNSTDAGKPHCDEIGHDLIEGHCERTTHGEINAVLNASRSDLVGSSIFILGTPCIHCAKALVGTGVAEVHCLGTYANSRGADRVVEYLESNNVHVTFHPLDPIDIIINFLIRLSIKGGPLFGRRQELLDRLTLALTSTSPED